MLLGHGARCCAPFRFLRALDRLTELLLTTMNTKTAITMSPAIKPYRTTGSAESVDSLDLLPTLPYAGMSRVVSSAVSHALAFLSPYTAASVLKPQRQRLREDRKGGSPGGWGRKGCIHLGPRALEVLFWSWRDCVRRSTTQPPDPKRRARQRVRNENGPPGESAFGGK